MNLYHKVHDKLGVMARGITLALDCIDYCPLRCPTCAAGILPRRDGHKMSIETFREILDKLEAEAKIRVCQLYVYSDLFVHPLAHLFVQELTRRGIKSQTSTMLQTMKADLEAVVEARPSEFRISFAGWHLEKHQRGGTVERFMKNLAWVSKLPRHPETTWTMFFHAYRSTLSEIPYAQRLAADHGLKFVALPAIFMPMEHLVEGYTKEDIDTISDLLQSPEEAVSGMKVDSNYCPLHTKMLCLTARADVMLCELVYEPRFILGNWLDPNVTLKSIQAKIQSHPFCRPCMDNGWHTYQQCFASPLVSDDIVNEANKKRGYRP